MTYLELFEKLRKEPMNEAMFKMYVANIGGLYSDADTQMQLLKGCGAPLKKRECNNEILYELNTKYCLWQQSEIVFVDIETNGSKPEHSDIIEIGAIKVRNGEIIEIFESFVFSTNIPENITQITGIHINDIKDAPRAKDVLTRFREFLGDRLFVAHNAEFDYGFIDFHLRRLGLFGLLNPMLCTIELSRKTILAPRYKLGFLNEFLGLGVGISHRAKADALAAFRLFETARIMLPQNVQTLQDLIDFSKGRMRGIS